MKAMEVINVIEFDMEHFSQKKPTFVWMLQYLQPNRIGTTNV